MLIRYSEVTPKDVFLNRRKFIAAAGAALTAFPAMAGTKLLWLEDEFRSAPDEKPTPYEAVTQYNNFYEFGTAKDQPAQTRSGLQTSPWQGQQSKAK